MVTKFVILFLFILSVLALLVAFGLKLAWHFRFLRVQSKKPEGEITDFFTRNFTSKGDDERWKKAWFIFPLLFGVEEEETDKPEILLLKRRIRKHNLAIYVILIIAMLLTVYASKAFPQGIF